MSSVAHRFAKTFDVGAYQLLVFIDRTDDNEDDHTALHQMVDVGVALLDLTLRGPDAAMRKVFEGYEQDNAINFFTISTVQKMINMVEAQQ